MKYIVQMWKRIFDYKGKSDRKEYWIPFAFNAVLTVIMVLCLFLKEAFMLTFMAYIAIAVAVYLGLSFVPFISLTVRRLHDAGKSGKWYLLSFILGIGSVIVILMCAGRADMFDPYANLAVGVYGPPPDYEDYDPSENLNVDVYGPPAIEDEFDPSMNTQIALYGPPEYSKIKNETSEKTSDITAVTYPETEVSSETIVAEDTRLSENETVAEETKPSETKTVTEETEASETKTVTEETEASETKTVTEETEASEPKTVTEETEASETTADSEETASTETTLPAAEDYDEPVFDPEENMNEDVYGPPEYFDPDYEADEPDLSDPDYYDPEENNAMCVYGPPEYFE